MKNTQLSRQQKKFIAAVTAGTAPMEAYCSAYKTRHISAPTLQKRVDKLMRAAGLAPPSPETGETETELKASVTVGLPAITVMLLDAYNKASSDSRGATAMIAATLALAKLYGHIHDKPDTMQNSIQTSDLLAKVAKARQRIKKENEKTASQKNE